MNISTTIPDDAVAAWQYRVDLYNAGSGQPPVTLEEFCQINRNVETTANLDAYATHQLQQLVPLGQKYNAAPLNVQTQVDALLAPYNPPA